MRASDLLTPAALGLALLLQGGDARAYCRTSSCPATQSVAAHTAQVCTPPNTSPDLTSDCGIPLFWANPCVGFSIQKDASHEVTFAQTEQTLKAAFQTWMSAACAGGGMPSMLVTEAAPADCDKHEYNQNAGNANIIMYHDDAWPYEGQSNAILALTTVTYNIDTGEIYDADMELNSADVNFTVGNGNIDYDLLSIVTHETGHFLGMAHSSVTEATMFPDYMEHSTALRTLDPDDIAGICAIYPPGTSSAGCDPTPRHCFSPLCAAQQTAALTCDSTGTTTTGGCCSVAPGSAGGDTVPAAALAAAGAALLVARRRRAQRRAR